MKNDIILQFNAIITSQRDIWAVVCQFYMTGKLCATDKLQTVFAAMRTMWTFDHDNVLSLHC